MRNMLALLLTLPLLIAACSGESGTPADGEIRISELPQVRPQMTARVDSADTSYFQHLGYKSVPREDGSFVIYDRESGTLFHLDAQAQLLQRLTRKGRGPGEVQDITSLMETPEGGLLIYDQRNNKVIRFGSDLAYRDEFTPEPFEGGNLVSVYPGASDTTYIMRFGTSEWLRDPSEEMDMVLVPYFPESRRYGTSHRMHDRYFAHRIISDQVVGGMMVPYAPTQRIRYHSASGNLWFHLTGSEEVAEVSVQLDTLRTIQLNLPGEDLSSVERDSLRKGVEQQQWETLQEDLPDIKAPVDSLVVGTGGDVWLELNYRGESDRWLVLGDEGEPRYVVHLPKGSLLLHVSPRNLAVRLDPVTLALFEGTSSFESP
ncbi:MAG: hypothetical protein U5K31_06350 [Balneolaceae bacterium]|nr:hypothetical protein [Balneolaceae bacterium]